MNVTLIQPYTGEVDIEPPKSLACLAAVLDKTGHKARIIDLQIPEIRRNWKTIFNSEMVDLVGVTAMTPQVNQAHKIAEQIKAILPDVTIVAGGVHATLLPKQTLQEFSAFDILVIGEGEHTITELVSKMGQEGPFMHESVCGIAYRSNGEIKITSPRPRIQDMDSLPNHHDYYDFDYYLHNNTLDSQDNSVSLIVSRGCPYNCKFCATRNFWETKYVNKSTNGVIEEIRYVMKRGGEFLRFRDSTFVINKKWVHELCGKMINEKLRIRWTVNARVDLVDYDLFRHMKKAGLDSVYFGVESGSQRILDFYGKGVKLEQVENAFEICRKLKIKTGAYFMLGALPETREDMDATYKFAKKLKATNYLVFIFMPLPGSALYDYYIEKGYKFDYSNIRSDKASFPSAGMSLEELENLRDKWWEDLNRVNEKPNLILNVINRVLEVRSLKDVRRLWKKVVKRLS